MRDEQADIWAAKGYDIAQEYWDNTAHAKRCEWFAGKIKSYKPDSIFEVGIMGGRNLSILQSHLGPDIKFGGIDVSEGSVKFAKEHVPDADFAVSSVYDMNTSDKYDMVFTAGVMIHIPPDGIDIAIKKCIEKAKRYVIHLEGLSNDYIVKGPEELSPHKVGKKFQWRPNLVERYKTLGLNPVVKKVKHTNPARDLSHLIVVKLEDYNDR